MRRRHAVLLPALAWLCCATPAAAARTTYRSAEDYTREMHALAAAHPAFVRVVALPVRSVQGRLIEGVVVGGGPASPVALVVGLTHAREWPSGEVALAYALDLVAARSQPRIAALLRAVRTVVVPVANPDGFVASQQGEPARRRNARGVDLNRNFGAFWGGPGASVSPSQDTFRGPAPWSEPEAQAIHALSAALPVTNVVSLHNVGGLVLRPPGFRALGLAPDEPGLRRLGDAMGVAAGYRSEYAADLYEATGALEDWNYVAQGAYGYTIELGENDGDRSFTGRYATHVTEQYLGSAPVEGVTPRGGVRAALMLASEQAQDPRDHALVSGRAPAGRVLRLRKSFTTLTSPLCVDDTCSATTPAFGIPDGLALTLRVPASGVFAWHVGPSTRPFVARGGGREAWTLECLAGDVVVAAHDVVVGRGERARVDPCVAGSGVSVARNPAARMLLVEAPTRRGTRIRARTTCARSCTVTARLRTTAGALVATHRATLAAGAPQRLSLRAGAASRRLRLSVTAVDSVGERVTARRTVPARG